MALCCLCLFVGGFAVACGANETTKKGWQTVTFNGRTYVVTEIGKVTLDKKP